MNNISMCYNIFMSFYFITGSKEKFEEVKTIIPEIEQINIDLPEIQEIDAKKVITAKLEHAFNHEEGEFIVEDISLYLDSLNGLPGPLIKWFMKTIGNEGLVSIANKLNNTGVTAKTLIGYAKNKNTIHFFEGEIKGTIVSPRGTMGFGWDPIFQPEGLEKTFAEMTKEEKNSISMRKMAAIKLKEHLSHSSL